MGLSIFSILVSNYDSSHPGGVYFLVLILPKRKLKFSVLLGVQAQYRNSFKTPKES